MSKIRYKKKRLANGANMIVLTGFPSGGVSMSAFIRAGFRKDPPGKPGLAHFTEHMLFRGTKKFPTAQKMADEIDRFGGLRTAFTWIEHQAHTIQIPESAFQHGLEVLLEAITQPLIKQVDVEKEKGTISEEITRNLADSQKAVWDMAWTPLLFQGTSMARAYSGSINDIKKINSTDIKEFIADNFVPDNTTFLFAGQIDEDLAGSMIENYFKGSYKTMENRVEEIKETKRIQVFQHDFYNQSSFIFGLKLPPLTDSRHAQFDILQTLLAGRYGSRLVQKLNKMGLIYDWISFIDYSVSNGYFVFNIACATSNLVKILRLVIAEFERVGKGDISAQEIAVAKGYLMGNIVLSKEKRVDYIEWYGMQEILSPGNITTIEDQVQEYNRVTDDSVINVAQEFFKKNNFLLAVAGDIQEDRLLNIFS